MHSTQKRAKIFTLILCLYNVTYFLCIFNTFKKLSYGKTGLQGKISRNNKEIKVLMINFLQGLVD